MRLDQTNLRLLELLQQDARMTFSNLARILNRAESTIRERILMMEQRGVIRGYRAVVDQSKLSFPVRAVVELECDLATLPALTQKLKAIPNVVQATVMTGARPVSVELVAEDLAKLEQLVQRQFSNVGVKGTSVRLVMQTLLEDRPGPLVPAQPVLLPSHAARPVRYQPPQPQPTPPLAVQGSSPPSP